MRARSHCGRGAQVLAVREDREPVAFAQFERLRREGRDHPRLRPPGLPRRRARHRDDPRRRRGGGRRPRPLDHRGRRGPAEGALRPAWLSPGLGDDGVPTASATGRTLTWCSLGREPIQSQSPSHSVLEAPAFLSLDRSQRPLERDHRTGLALARLHSQHREHLFAAGYLRLAHSIPSPFFAASHSAVVWRGHRPAATLPWVCASRRVGYPRTGRRGPIVTSL